MADAKGGGVIRFTYPLLATVAIPLLCFVLYRLAMYSARISKRRLNTIKVLLGLASLCAALAVTGFSWAKEVDRMAVIYALDQSRSVAGHSAETTEALQSAIDTMQSDDVAGVVVFGGRAATEILPSARPNIGERRMSVAKEATNLEQGIRHALADIPEGYAGRVVVVSDGVETDGDALAAAAIAAGRGVRIDALAIDRKAKPEVAVSSVRVPQKATKGEPIEVRVLTHSSQATAVQVTVSRSGLTIAKGVTQIGKGEDLIILRDVAPDPGVHRYDVEVTPVEPSDDSSPRNNHGGAFLRVTGESSVFVVSGQPSDATPLVQAIEADGLKVRSGSIKELPLSLGEMAAYDLLVLNDLPARSLTDEQMKGLASYVHDLGGGLLMTGARKSFGLGGYAYTPVEKVLPATFDLRKKRDRLSLSMVIAIDNSGSMGIEVKPGVTKLDLANEAAARSAMLLSTADRVGVMHVDTAVHWTQPMVDVVDPKAIAGRVRHAQAGGGGIYVDITMKAAFAALKSENTQLKHFLLFSDGDDSENMTGTRAQVRAAMKQKITTSVVSMGNGPHSAELSKLSKLGGGRFYIVEDMRELPRIFTQETIEASRAALSEEAFQASSFNPGPSTSGIDFAKAPALGGYSIVNARPRATVLLKASEEDPLLATWQHGIGKSAVFTTDVGAEFGRAWTKWPGYAALFSQLTRSLARAPESSDAQVHVEIKGSVGTVRVEAVSEAGRYKNHLDISGNLALPGGGSKQVEIKQTGPGRYEGTFDANAPGPYLLTASDAQSGLLGSGGVVRPSGSELRGDGSNRRLLNQIAGLSGGRLYGGTDGNLKKALEELLSNRPSPVYQHQPMWPYLLFLSMLLMLLSVVARRLVLPSEWWKRSAKEQGAVVADAEPSSTQVLENLRSRKRKKEQDDREFADEIAAAAEQTRPVVSTVAASAKKTAEAQEDAPPTEGSLAERLLEKKRKR